MQTINQQIVYKINDWNYRNIVHTANEKDSVQECSDFVVSNAPVDPQVCKSL